MRQEFIMTEVDIYDFDKTLVPFDCGTRFVFWCALRYPWCALLIPAIGIAFFLASVGLISYTQFKRVCFAFLPLIPRKKAIRRFWDKYAHEAYPWATDRRRYSVIVSASPDFLLEDISARLGFDALICTRHNPKTGIIIGENCNGEEKVRRFYEEFDRNTTRVADVYSDSLRDDMPIFQLAQDNCYHITNGQAVRFMPDNP